MRSAAIDAGSNRAEQAQVRIGLERRGSRSKHHRVPNGFRLVDLVGAQHLDPWRREGEAAAELGLEIELIAQTDDSRRHQRPPIAGVDPALRLPSAQLYHQASRRL